MARRKRSSWDLYDSTPTIKTTGGIKAQTKRGAFGKSWWAKSWIEVLESFDLGGRLSRGRTYARKGQVTKIHIEKGLVAAVVQGSQPRPYQVTIKVSTLAQKDWTKLGEALNTRASFAARLLSGQMPDHIGEVFKAAGISLFPEKHGDLETDCSCPDWSNPCKHIAAVYYLLGEEFDRDPFLIFKLRGLDKEDLSALIGDISQEMALEEPLPPEPLPTDPLQFWEAKDYPDPLENEKPVLNAALPKRLGPFPFWRGEQHFMEAMEAFYGWVAQGSDGEEDNS